MKRYLGIFFISFVFVLPIVTYGSIVPCSGPDCNACSFVQLGNNIITWFIGIAASVIAAVIAWAGLKMVMAGGDTGAVSTAKGMMTNAVVGFVILLAAWLVVDTVMRMLVGSGGLGRPWNELQCTALPTRTTTQPSTPTASRTGTLAAGQVAHQDAKNRLEAAGITVTSTGGPANVRETCPGETGCTSLQGIREQTIQQAINIKNVCKCAVSVVGGTEHGLTGGMSHGNGYKIDIDDNAVIDAFLPTKLTAAGTRSGAHGGARYRDSCGNEYVRESHHWDITVSAGSCSL